MSRHSSVRVSSRTVLSLLTAAILSLGSAGAALAQTENAPVELQETDIFGMGARALGMGMAYTAVAEDVAAISFNPAGLAQIRRIELSGGFSHDGFERTVARSGSASRDETNTRLDHLVFAYPFPTYRGSFVVAFGFHRRSSLDDVFLKEGFLVAPSGGDGLYEVESFSRSGSLNQWSAAAAIDLSPNVSVGARVSYVTGDSKETLFIANGRLAAGEDPADLDLGSPSSPDDRLFRTDVYRESDVQGYTGSFGILFHGGRGIRVGAAVDFPTKLEYDGFAESSQEDYEKIDDFGQTFFRDDITMPFTVRGGASWGRNGLLLSGGVRWTDYTQIDFEGDILAPPSNGSLALEPAYRSVVGINLGAEYQLPTIPLRFRGGFFTEPIPYKLVAADADFVFVPDDGNAETDTDVSLIGRDYPEAEIRSDRRFYTAGAGVLIQGGLSLDAAFVHGTYERATPADYENGTDFFATRTTVEEVSENRVLVSTTLHFD